MQTTTIEQRKQLDYERFRDYSIAQMERDEITAAGEFLGTYTTSKIEYERDEIGLYIEDEAAQRLYLHEVSDTSAEKYDELAQLRPEVAWQARRVHAENEHIHFATTMPAGSLYVVISDCPEKELRELGRNEFGYRLDRRMGFVQLFHADMDGKVTIYGHSFDQNDTAGIQAMYGMFNKERDDSAWAISQPIYETDAEDVDPELLLERMIATYDTELSRRHGGEWFGGRSRAELREEGNSFVAKQTDLLQVHLEKLLFVNPKSDAANQLRYDFILAVRNRFENKVIPTNSSSVSAEMSGAGDMGRTMGESVDFCGMTISAETMSQMGEMEKIGFQLNAKKDWKKGNCVACLAENTYVGGCSVCASCEEMSNKGADLMEVRQAALQKQQELRTRALQAIEAKETKKAPQQPSKQQEIEATYGRHMEIRTRTTLGGAVTVVAHKYTGEVVARL